MEEKIIKTNRIGEKLSIGQNWSKPIELEKKDEKEPIELKTKISKPIWIEEIKYKTVWIVV